MKKILLAILVILIFSAAYFFIWKEEPVNNEGSGEEVGLSINTVPEAIVQAEKLSNGLEAFSLRYGANKIQSTAHFYEDDDYWYVSFWPENSSDLWYEVHVSSDGTLIYEGNGTKGG